MIVRNALIRSKLKRIQIFAVEIVHSSAYIATAIIFSAAKRAGVRQ